LTGISILGLGFCQLGLGFCQNFSWEVGLGPPLQDPLITLYYILTFYICTITGNIIIIFSYCVNIHIYIRRDPMDTSLGPVCMEASYPAKRVTRQRRDSGYLLPSAARQHTILDTWFLQSSLDPVFRASYVLSRSRSCVCL
jgi:hypothetical protein